MNMMKGKSVRSVHLFSRHLVTSLQFFIFKAYLSAFHKFSVEILEYIMEKSFILLHCQQTSNMFSLVNEKVTANLHTGLW